MCVCVRKTQALTQYRDQIENEKKNFCQNKQALDLNTKSHKNDGVTKFMNDRALSFAFIFVRANIPMAHDSQLVSLFFCAFLTLFNDNKHMHLHCHYFLSNNFLPKRFTSLNPLGIREHRSIGVVNFAVRCKISLRNAVFFFIRHSTNIQECMTQNHKNHSYTHSLTHTHSNTKLNRLNVLNCFVSFCNNTYETRTV